MELFIRFLLPQAVINNTIFRLTRILDIKTNRIELKQRRMAKKNNTPKPQTVNINSTQPQKPKPKKQSGQYDKIFQENLEKLLPLLIEKVLGMDIVHREQLPTRVQHTQERAPDILERVQLRDNRKKVLHIEVQLRDEQDMNFRLADYYVFLNYSNSCGLS